MHPRVVDPVFTSKTTTTRCCETEGCMKTTREGKPHCPDHVEHHAYVQSILEVLTAREDERERVRQFGPGEVDLSGLTASELVLHLSLHGSRTVERLSREFQLDSKVIHNYVDALRTDGQVVLGRTTRGSTVVRLAG